MLVPREQEFVTRSGLRLAARVWYDDESAEVMTPILALHGWLDNAASFDRLAPLLAGCHVVCLDLPGHGFSDHRHLQGTYNLWDDLRDIVDVIEALGWSQVALLGHSRGAMIATLLAIAMPELVSHLLLIDGVTPPPVAVTEFPTQLARHIRDYRRLRNRDLSYPSLEDAIRTRQKATGLSWEAAALIVERGIREEGGRYYWRSDPRLRGASAVRLTEAHNQVILDNLTVLTLAVLAQEGIGALAELQAQLGGVAHIQVETLGGHHHFHMEEAATEIARLIRQFFHYHPVLPTGDQQ